MANAIENKISDGINSALESVVSGKEEYYSKNPLPSIGDVKGLISSYSYKNAAISGGAGLIPGLWGMAAAVPEIITIVRNQMAMVKIRPLLSPRAKMLLQIHDELIFEVQDGCAEEFGAAAQKIMQEIYKLNVPLKTSLNVAKDWGGLK